MTDELWRRHALDLALEAIPGFAYEAADEGGAIRVSDGAEALLGPDGARAGWWKDRVHPEDLALVWPHVLATLSGDGTGHAVEYRLQDPGGRWRLVADRARGETESGRRRTAGLIVDVTEEREAADRLRHLAGELDHRVKNALANIMSLVTLTSAADAERGRPSRETVDALTGRVEAFSRVQTTLSGGRWIGADLRSLVQDEVRASGEGGAIVIEGPEMTIRAGAAQSIAMALHELSTNARRFGAWSDPEGSVAVAWAVEGDDFVLTWTEHGGPMLADPAVPSLGTQILRDMPSMEMQADVSLAFEKTGLRFTLRCPLSHVRAEVSVSAARERANAGSAVERPRVLVVEDVWSTAMIAVRALRARGWPVIGPVQTVEAAMDAVLERPDVVVLDLNLNNAFAISVAERLTKLGIPFLVATGYPDTAVRAAAVGAAPRLAKPYDEGALIDAIDALLAER